MASREQFCECPILDVEQDCKENSEGTSECNSNSSMVASSVLVSRVKEDGGVCTIQNSKQRLSNVEEGRDSRTFKKQKVEAIRLEGVWQDRLKHQCWSDVSIQKFLGSWALNTWNSYNRCFQRFQNFAETRDVQLVAVTPSMMADFLVNIAENSQRPRSVLMSTLSAVGSYYRVVQVQSPVTEDVMRLIDGIVKVGTGAPMKRSLVMPREPFLILFRKWGDNLNLSTWALRLKTVVLLS